MEKIGKVEFKMEYTMSEKVRGSTNPYCVGPPGVAVFNIPQEIQKEFGIDVKKKKSFFKIYTDKAKKRIIFEFVTNMEL